MLVLSFSNLALVFPFFVWHIYSCECHVHSNSVFDKMLRVLQRTQPLLLFIFIFTYALWIRIQIGIWIHVLIYNAMRGPKWKYISRIPAQLVLLFFRSTFIWFPRSNFHWVHAWKTVVVGVDVGDGNGNGNGWRTLEQYPDMMKVLWIFNFTQIPIRIQSQWKAIPIKTNSTRKITKINKN